MPDAEPSHIKTPITDMNIYLPKGGLIQKNTSSDNPKWALGPLDAPAMEVVFPLW